MLSPTEEITSFKSQVKFKHTRLMEPPEDLEPNVAIGTPTYIITPKMFFEYLSNEGFHEIDFHLNLLYTDELNNVYYSHILGGRGELTQEMDLKDMADLEHRLSGQDQQVISEVEEEGEYPPN